MKSIFENFESEQVQNIKVCKLKESSRDEFLSELPGPFRLCYVSLCKLKYYMRVHNLSAKECLEQFILPEVSAAQIISGDFGEMLSFIMIQEYQKLINIPVIGPRKWQWKGDRNKAAQGSDIVFFHTKSKIPSEDDTVITIEAKMKSLKSNKNPIQDAIDGATDDKLTRMVKSLSWFDQKLAKDGKVNLRSKLRRFRVPSEYKSYKKEYKAIAIIDKDLFKDEINKQLHNLDSEIEIWAVSVPSLKDAYGNNYTEMSNISW